MEHGIGLGSECPSWSCACWLNSRRSSIIMVKCRVLLHCVAIVFGYRCECGAVGVLWALFSRDLNLVDQTPVCTHHCLLLGLGRGLGLAVAASVGLGHGSELHLTLPKPLTATLCTAQLAKRRDEL